MSLVKDIEAAKAVVAAWYERHFGSYTPGTELHALAQRALNELRHELGIGNPAPPPPAPPENKDGDTHETPTVTE